MKSRRFLKIHLFIKSIIFHNIIWYNILYYIISYHKSICIKRKIASTNIGSSFFLRISILLFYHLSSFYCRYTKKIEIKFPFSTLLHNMGRRSKLSSKSSIYSRLVIFSLSNRMWSEKMNLYQILENSTKNRGGGVRG